MGIENSEIRTILFALLNGNENLDSCRILAQVLRERGHRIIFTVDKTCKGLLQSSGFEEHIYNSECVDKVSKLDLNCLNGSPIDKIRHFSYDRVVQTFGLIKRIEDFNNDLIKRLKPDLIIIESLVCSPSLTNSGIPWVWLNFGPPNLCRSDDRIAPAWSDLTQSKPNEWIGFREEFNQIFKGLKQELNDWCVSKGSPELDDSKLHPHSPYLNIYVYPTELDYNCVNTWELKTWVQFDGLIEPKPHKKLLIPEPFKSRPGKLVYLSMGAFASVELMKRLTTILSKSENNFIVSKGPLHNEYELADNMWGSEDIPLTDVINNVSLVVSNGDNNTIIETFYYSKPLIVLPLFEDQLTNSIRLKEKGFGWGLDPFNCTSETLLMMISSMIEDKPLARRLLTISNNMRTTKTGRKMAEEIESIFKPRKGEAKTPW